MVTLQEIKQNEAIRVLIRSGNRYLEAMGYTWPPPRRLCEQNGLVHPQGAGLFPTGG